MKNKVKKLAAMLLMCTLMIVNLGLDVYAEASVQQTKAFTLAYVNPLYEDILSESDLKESSPDYGISTLAEPEYISDESIVVDMIREAMVQRQEQVTVYYTQKGDVSEEILNEWVDLALEETGNPKEGDYLRWHYGGFRGEGNGWSYGDTVYYTFDFTFTYYTTAEQEAAVDAAISETLDNLELSEDMEKHEIVKTIYDYICENIIYDEQNLNDESYKLKYSTYAALINKTAVCQGYATLLYRMLREVGIETRVIAGVSYDVGHAWNIVKLKEQYYCLDSTWDAGQETYAYFLKGTENFDNHASGEEYTADEFTNKYPISSTDFDETEIIENPFTDLKDTDYYYDEVLWAVEKGITSGITKTLFKPDDTCTRGQVVTFLWSAAGRPKTEGAANPFTDVSENAYYYEAVLWAVDKGITSGVTETLFKPEDACTRGQVVTFFWRASQESEIEGVTNPFTDVAENAYYYDEVLWAVEKEITKGWTNTLFAPEMECTRGQIVTFLYRYYH